jgi:molybdenum ABC transporter molybdate-binding protein
MTRTGLVAAASLVALAGLVAGLAWRARTPDGPPALVVYAAAATRLPLEAAAAAYQEQTGRAAELRFGASEEMLVRVRDADPARPGDLFLPADDSYVHQAREWGLVAESRPLARMRAVVLTAPGNPKSLTSWADLVKPDVRVAVPNPGAAVGKLTRGHLERTGRWTALRRRAVDTGTVTEAANAARTGAADAAVVWDAVAAGPHYRGQEVLDLPELHGVEGRVEVATLAQSADPDAARAFAEFLADPAGGLRHFREAGFRVEP